MQTLDDKVSPTSSRPAPLFVVGMWRSGTSLFYALVNQHPQIALTYEDDLARLWPLFLRRRPKKDWPERLEFWNSALSRHQIEVAELQRDVSGLREACLTIWKEHAGEAIGGCKSPSYFDYLPRLAEEFPGAKFIVIWRDPADICRSVVRAAAKDSFWSRKGMLLRTLLGYQVLKTGYDALLARGVSVHAVEYETLVSNPSETMAGVCSFLNLQFVPRMASLKDADRSAIYEAGHHQSVKSESITPRQKREEVLSPRFVRKLERYVAFWRRNYRNEWPLCCHLAHRRGRLSFLERLVDRTLYRGLRIFDELVICVYCLAPLGVLRAYRSLKYRKAGVEETEKDLLHVSQQG